MGLIYKVKSVETLYNQLKQIMLGKGSQITNFNVGSRMRTLFESISQILNESQYDFHKTIKEVIPLAVFNGFEFERLGGVQAIGTIEFRRATSAPSTYPIPVGTAILLDGITFQTTIAGEITSGNVSSGNIDAECAEEGTVGNILTGAIDTLSGQGSFVNQPVGIESAINNGDYAGGEDEESDADRLARFRDYVNSLARSTPLGIKSGAESVDGVVSATVVENYPQNGYITVYADGGTGGLPAGVQTEVEKVLNGDPNDRVNYPGYRAAGIIVVVVEPTIINVTVTAEIKILQSSLADDTSMENLVESNILTYINTLPLGFDVMLTELTQRIMESHSDIFDVIITNPASNTTITSSQVARTNTGLITITSSRTSA